MFPWIHYVHYFAFAWLRHSDWMMLCLKYPYIPAYAMLFFTCGVKYLYYPSSWRLKRLRLYVKAKLTWITSHQSLMSSDVQHIVYFHNVSQHVILLVIYNIFMKLNLLLIYSIASSNRTDDLKTWICLQH